jgi:hypothetical protein
VLSSVSVGGWAEIGGKFTGHPNRLTFLNFVSESDRFPSQVQNRLHSDFPRKFYQNIGKRFVRVNLME